MREHSAQKRGACFLLAGGWVSSPVGPLQLPGAGNGNPLQYSCLENSVDRGAWWAAVYGVAQSRARLKRLSMRARIGEGNSNPLQGSCLENPRDGGAWWAAVHRVTQSRTRLKRLSSSSSSRARCGCWRGGTAGGGPALSAHPQGPCGPWGPAFLWHSCFGFCFSMHLSTRRAFLPLSRGDKGSSQATVHSPLNGCQRGSRELCGRPGRLLVLWARPARAAFENRNKSGASSS